MASYRIKKSPKLAILIISGIFACILIIFTFYKNLNGEGEKNPVVLGPTDGSTPLSSPEKLPDTKNNDDNTVGPSKADGNTTDPKKDGNENDDSTPDPTPSPPGPSETESDDDTPAILIELIRLKDFDNIVKILDLDPVLVTDVITEGKYLIHLAALESYTDLVRELVKRGSDVNASSDEFLQIKPLHLAARFESTNVMEILISHGAQIDATDINGETPLFNAVVCDQLESAKYLLDRGADPNLLISPKEFDNALDGVVNIKTMLNTAISLKQADMVNLLLSYKAKPELSDSLGMNALHAAAFYGRANVIKSLLAVGSLDINAKMPESSIFGGKTALEIAEATGHNETANRLRGAPSL